MFIRSHEGVAFQTSASFSSLRWEFDAYCWYTETSIIRTRGDWAEWAGLPRVQIFENLNINELRKKKTIEEVKFPPATEQIWANQSSFKCTVLVIARNARRFVLWSETNSVRTRGSSLNFEGKRFCHGHKIWLINIFMKNWAQRSKSREIRIIEVWMIGCAKF